MFLDLLFIFLVLFYQNCFLQQSLEEINQNSLKWHIYLTLKEVKLLVLVWQVLV